MELLKQEKLDELDKLEEQRELLVATHLREIKHHYEALSELNEAGFVILNKKREVLGLEV